jgi:hypothetical protein
VLRTGRICRFVRTGTRVAASSAVSGAVVALLMLPGCASSGGSGAAASVRATPAALGSNSVPATSQLNASQAAAAREFGVLMLQGDALGNAPNPQNSGGVGANDLANFAATKTLVMKAIVVLQSVSWPTTIAPDVQNWIASGTSALADVAALTALPTGSVTGAPGASALSSAIHDLSAWSKADTRVRAEFGLPPDKGSVPSP